MNNEFMTAVFKLPAEPGARAAFIDRFRDSMFREFEASGATLTCLAAGDESALAEAREVCCERIASEALNNLPKHSEAASCIRDLLRSSRAREVCLG